MPKRLNLAIGAGLALAVAPLAASPATLLPGTYTNEEQVYFARDAGKAAIPWTGIRIEAAGADFAVQRIDGYGAPLGAAERWRLSESPGQVRIRSGACARDFAVVPAGLTIINQSRTCAAAGGPTTITAKGIAMLAPDGTAIELLRARAFKCWASMPRKAPKDGKVDWWFKPGLMLHDAGGRVAAVTDEAVPQRFSLRMRNVAFPTGPNQPSLVLYVHTDDPDHAIGYSWADPGASRVGINLRTMQASCSLVTPP